MDNPAIVIERFTKAFGSHVAVRDLSLEVPSGCVFALAGPNGAGKSTTIRALLDLVRPTRGRLEILGLDSVRDSLAVRRRAGYLPERPVGFPWMTVREALSFHAAFYAGWDSALAESLRERLDLPPDRRLRDLSRGMQAKAGLVMALAQRPELLLLDDPTMGLDPVVRQEFLEAVIENVQAEGGTVFFSSHLLHEVERVADEVAILKGGRLAARGSLDHLKSTTRLLRAVYPAAPPSGVPLSGVLRTERGAHHLSITMTGYHEGVPDALRAAGAESVEVRNLSLEEIFVATVKGNAA